MDALKWSDPVHEGECIPVSVLGLPLDIIEALDREFGCVQMLSLVGYRGVLGTRLPRQKVELVAVAMESLGYAFQRLAPLPVKTKRKPDPLVMTDALSPLFDIWGK